MDELGLKLGERVADIGCGAGTTTLQLAARVGPGGSVTGFDISVPQDRESAVEAVRAALAKYETNGVVLMQATWIVAARRPG